MTFKKSMISIAAAGVIAAGLTGCGSSSSGTAASTNTDTTSGGSTASGVSTIITASKGYIQDANVTGYDANGTALYAYTYTAGSNGVYTVKDGEDNLTSATLSEVDYITIKPKGALTVLHMLGDDGKDANITNGSFTVPAKGTTVINSITALAYQMAKADATDYNLSDEANVTALIGKIEKSLGVSGAATTDPKNNDLLNDVNRLLGAMTPAKAAALGTALIAKTAPTDLAGAIANISSAAQTASDSTFKSYVDMAKTYVVDGSLKSLNLEKAMASVLNGSALATSLFQPISTTSDLRLVSGTLQINGVAADGLPGHKLNNTADKNVSFKMLTPATDANLTNSEATFFANFTAKENNSSVNYTKNTAISMELSDMNMTNYSDGKVKFTENDSNLSKVMVKVTSTTDEGVDHSDSWSLKDLGLAAGAVVTDASANAGTTTFAVQALYNAVKTALDANHTTSSSTAAYTNLSALNGGIDDVTIGLKAVDANGTTMSVLGYNQTTDTAYATTSATVGASSGTALFKQSMVDLRSAADIVNNAPSLNGGADFTDSNISTGNANNTDASVDGATNVQMWNVVTTANNAVSKLNLSWDAESALENNATVTVKMADTIEGNTTTKSVDFLANEFNATKLADSSLLSATNTNAMAIDFMVDANHTIASNPTGRHPMATYTFTPTDEFGKVGKDTNLTIALNRAPSSTDTAVNGRDINATGYAGSVSTVFGDTAATPIDINITDTNTSLLALANVDLDANVAGALTSGVIANIINNKSDSDNDTVTYVITKIQDVDGSNSLTAAGNYTLHNAKTILTGTNMIDINSTTAAANGVTLLLSPTDGNLSVTVNGSANTDDLDDTDGDFNVTIGVKDSFGLVTDVKTINFSIDN